MPPMMFRQSGSSLEQKAIETNNVENKTRKEEPMNTQ